MQDIQSEKEVSYKYLTKEFVDLGDEIRHIGEISRLCKTSPGMVSSFFNYLESLDERYSEHFNNNDIAKALEDVEKYLINESYLRDLDKLAKSRDEAIIKKILSYEIKILKKLKAIWKLMNVYFTHTGMKSTPKKINIDKFPEVKNTTMKEIMKGVSSIIEK